MKDPAKGLHAKVHLVRVDGRNVQEILAFSIASTVSTAGASIIGAARKQVEREDRKEAQDYLARVASSLQAEGLDVSWEIVEGRPADAIVELAHPEKTDLVAMSTHGRAGLGRVVLGSTAEEVLRGVGIPVLLVKPKPKIAEKQG